VVIKKVKRPSSVILLEENKKVLRQKPIKEDEKLSEWEMCRKYSKTMSMGQD
tara:strand:+ start:825 stop:980 length:156 start_codon:yes stop_codon:yes gene_type:complete